MTVSGYTLVQVFSNPCGFEGYFIGNVSSKPQGEGVAFPLWFCAHRIKLQLIRFLFFLRIGYLTILPKPLKVQAFL